MSDLKNMNGPLPGPLAKLKELAQIGSVVMKMNNVQRAILLFAAVQATASFVVLSMATKTHAARGRAMVYFGAFFMALSGLSAFYLMTNVPKDSYLHNKLVFTTAYVFALCGIIFFSIGYATMKKETKEFGSKEDNEKLNNVLWYFIPTALLSIAFFVTIYLKYTPVEKTSSFGSYDYRYFY